VAIQLSDDILSPVTKMTTAQVVAHRMLEMIRRGIWAAGAQLPTEKELMQKLAVGRSTIREALQILSTINVVQATAGHGTFIKAPTAAGVFRPDLIAFLIGNPFALELLEAREMIEPQCVRLAAIRGTEEDFDRIEQLLDAHHAAYLEGSPVSKFAARFHVMLEILMQRGRQIDHIPDYQKREVKEHREILSVVRSREPDRAAEMMRRHIVKSATTYDTGDIVKKKKSRY
jgi:DNA-binding FadR family transcriptional regulator